MTLEEVKDLVHSQAVGNFSATNNHGISLNQALIPPQRIAVVARNIQNSRLTDKQLDVWLVGEEDDYKIVMHKDGMQFGLASKGFPADRYPILCGWYGGLVSAFLAM